MNEQNSSTTGVSDRRRKLLRAGVAGGPALLALKSSPVLATNNCKLPSGFSVSGNYSQTRSYTCTKAYKGPGAWSSTTTKMTVSGKPSYWVYTGTSVKTTSQFSEFFKNANGIDGSIMFKDLLTKSPDVRALFGAALLNALVNDFPIGHLTVRKIWDDAFAGSGYTPPNTTAKWGRDDAEGYIRYLLGLPPLKPVV